MYALTMDSIAQVSGGDKTLQAEAVVFGDIAVAAALTGAEPVAAAATLNFSFG